MSDSSARRRIMQSIRKTDTKPERHVRSTLHRMGLRFRLHRSDLPGVPDIVLPSHRAVVFVNGCFWHQHACKLGKRPKSNLEYWEPKLRRNQERDRANSAALRAVGWRIVVVWECEIGDELEAILRKRLSSASS